MDVIKEIKFPSENADWLKKILIGGILNMIPIVNFISSGYNLDIMKKAIENRSEMPEWDDWGNLFIKGLMVFIISLIYLIIPIIILFVSLGGIIFAVISAIISGDISMAVGAIAGAIGGILLGLVLMVIFGFFIPMAIAMYINEDKLGAAFRLKEVLSRIISVLGDYLAVYIVLIVLWFILGLFGSVPLLGFLILMFGGFYISVVGANMFGKVYSRSTY